MGKVRLRSGMTRMSCITLRRPQRSCREAVIRRLRAKVARTREIRVS